MGIVRFDVELDKPGKTYENGSDLIGKVYLNLDSPKSVTALKMTVFGRGKIFFKRGKQNFHAKEIYVNEDYYLLGEDGPMVLPAGRHVYPFSLKLPETIPNTYKDTVGRIEYELKATIQRPWYLWNHRDATSFTVVVPLDLNADPRAAAPVVVATSQMFMGCSDPVHMDVSLPARGYIPGQTMPIMVHIKNEARVDIQAVNLMLIKVNLYRASFSRTRRDELVLAEHETPVPTVEVGGIETRIQLLLQIPHVQPSFLKYSGIIDLEYLIRVKARVGGFHLNFDLDVPVIIGTIALLGWTVATPQGTSSRQEHRADPM